jgi:AcrR family transcriptional regulator
MTLSSMRFLRYTAGMTRSTSLHGPSEHEPRGARRKRETRSKLLAAALRLMAEKGLDGVAINEITEAADVGFGSFYNHFESKEAIYQALVDSVFEEFADWLDRLLADVHDPAEVISASVRHTIARAQNEPLWGQFLIREGFPMREVNRGLGRRVLRDIQKGIDAGRFLNGDPVMSFVAVSGTVLASIAVALTDLHLFSTEHLPERCAAVVLQTLGLDQQAANEIARRPLGS